MNVTEAAWLAAPGGNLSATRVVPTASQRLLVSVLEITATSLGVLSVFVNSKSLLAMFFLRDKRSAYLRFLRNLNLTDLLASLTFLVIQNAHISADTPTLVSVSYVLRSLPWMFLTAYMLTLLSLAVNQYVAVCRPWHYSRVVTDSFVSASIGGIWLASTLQVIVPLCIVLAVRLQAHADAGAVVARVAVLEMQAWMLLFTLVILANVFLNIRVYQQIRILRKRLAHRKDSDNIRAKHKAFLTMTYLLLTGVFFWFPFPLVGLLGVSISSIRDPVTWKVLNAAISVLLYVNCLVDPLIFILRVNEIRSAYKNMLMAFKPKAKGYALPPDVNGVAPAINQNGEPQEEVRLTAVSTDGTAV